MNHLQSKNLLHLEDIQKVYGNKIVLRDIDLSVSEGEFTTLVGPSGCGKSTLLRIILGQEKPTKGIITIDQKTVRQPDPERGIVYQHYSLYPHRNVLDNVLMGYRLKYAPFSLKWLKDRPAYVAEAMHFLKKVKLENDASKYPHELSGGMRQRVAVVQSLIMKPRILMMDEPFGALDPGTREDLQVFLLELWEEYKLTIFFITHDLEEAVYLGSRLIVLSQYFTESSPEQMQSGSRIVFDQQLSCRTPKSTMDKSHPKFQELIQQIKQDGFDPDYLQHVKAFNLKHPDSFQTL